jgi:hypothetical protein
VVVVSVVNLGDGRVLTTVRLNPAGGLGERFFSRLRVQAR